ncbi:MAG: Panacea domain-containing protein [Terracidiphilus sp.]
MLLDFNIDKAIAAAGFLLEQDGGSDNMFPFIKKLYYADRSALIGWGQSITGDRLASLEKGPVVSRIYDLLKGKGTEENLIKWNNFIQREHPYTIVVRKSPNKGLLSKRERDILEESRKTISAIRGSIPIWLHKHCPEWSDPGKSSSPIDPSNILRIAKKSEEEIRQLEEANQEIHFLKYLMATY